MLEGKKKESGIISTTKIKYIIKNGVLVHTRELHN